MAAAAGNAQPPAPASAEKRTELREIQNKLRELQKELARTEENRAEAADELRDIEQSISIKGRRLHELSEERKEAERALSGIQQRQQALERQISLQQERVARMLRRQYATSRGESLRQMLSGDDPNQISRDFYFMQRLTSAQTDLIAELRRNQQENARLQEQARERRESITQIETRQKSELAELGNEQRKRKSLLVSLQERLHSQRQEVGTLQRNEARLARLIDALARMAPAKPAPPRPKADRGTDTDSPGGSTDPASVPPAQRESVARNESTLPGNASFAQLKGRMGLPVPGQITNRFGTPRSEGGTSWRGVFIRAAAGAAVRAVAAGRIAFADWLRGFGNLIIVDHGNGYLSVYGNNETLYKSAGQTVSAGDTIAAVGNSGGNEDSGLYFEIRQQGQAVDPLRWLSAR